MSISTFGKSMYQKLNCFLKLKLVLLFFWGSQLGCQNRPAANHGDTKGNAESKAANTDSLPVNKKSDAFASHTTDVPKVRWAVEWDYRPPKNPGYPLLENVRSSVVHPPSVESGAYHHHPQICFWQDRLVASWSRHPTGEDGPGQDVVWAYSFDGMDWKIFAGLFDQLDEVQHSTANGICLTAAPFVEFDNRLFAVAVINEGIGYGKFDSANHDEAESETHSAEFPMRIRRAQGFLVREISDEFELQPVFWLGRESQRPDRKGLQDPPADVSPKLVSRL